MTQQQQVVKELKAGLKLLVRDGWCQGLYHNTDGRRCAVGALTHPRRPASRPGDDTTDGALTALVSGIKKVTPGCWWPVQTDAHGRVTSWNDRRGRTAGQVKQAFRHAIRIAERAATQ